MKIQKVLCSILICILLIATIFVGIIDVYAKGTNPSLVKNNSLLLSGNAFPTNSLHHDTQYLASDKANKLESQGDEDTWKLIDSKNSIPSYEVYLARTIIEGYGKGPTVYNIFINSDYPLVYQQLAKYAMEEKNLYYSSGLWLTYFDNIFKNCPRYAYEAILMSYLDYDANSSGLNNTMKENVNAFGVELMTTLLSSVIDDKVEDNDDALKVKNQIIALPKNEAKTVLKEKVILELDAGMLAGSINGREDIPELISNLSVLNSADKKRKGQIAFLEKMQNRIKDNDDLKAAIKDIVYCFKSKDVISLWSQAGKQNVYMFGKVLASAGWEKLIDSAGPEVALVLKGVRLGGSGMNALFGTTTLSQDLMTILTLYIIDNEFKNTVRSLKENFLQNPNQKNAIAFNTAIDSYIAYQKFADFTAKQYVYDIINSGLLTETFTKIFYNENIKTAEELMARCDDNIRSRNKLYDITKTIYKNYCEDNHLEIYSTAYDMLCEETNVWKIIPEKKEDEKDPYFSVVDNLLSYYGKLRLIYTDDGCWEANGVCYLNLVDFTQDGIEELIAVTKNETDDHYSCFIYSKEDNNQTAKLLFENKSIELESVEYTGSFSFSYTKDTGYLLRTGRNYSDLTDEIIYRYDGTKFSPVYDYYYYWDADGDHSIRNNITIDIYDDNHREEFYKNEEAMSVTLRSFSCVNQHNEPFDMKELQKSILDVLDKINFQYGSDLLTVSGYENAADYINTTPQELADILNLPTRIDDDYVIDFTHKGKTVEDSEYATMLECDKEDLDIAGSWDLYIVNDPSISVSGIRIGMEKEDIQESIDITRWIFSDEYIYDNYSSLITYNSKEADNRVLQFIIKDDRVDKIRYIRNMGDGE